MEKGAHEVGVNDEQTGADMEKKKKKIWEAARNPPVEYRKVFIKESIIQTLTETCPIWKGKQIQIQNNEPNTKAPQHVGGLHTQVSSPTLSNLPCWDENFSFNSSKANVDSSSFSTAKPLSDLWGQAAAKREDGKAGRETEKERDGISERESKLTKCDWYSSLLNPHPPWLTRWMNN